MSGLSGLVRIQESRIGDIVSMNSVIRHRGHDGEGHLLLDGQEICNYNDARAELRSKGYQFTTRKDTELSWQHTLNGVRNSLKRKTECGS